MGNSKHIGTRSTKADHVSAGLKMLHHFAGSEEAWRTRPFVSMSNCFVVPPMTFAEESLERLRVGVESGIPILLFSARQAGATAIIGTWPFISNLRTGAISGDSPEQGVLSVACAQMGNYFDLPTGTACGMTDAKFSDFQAGAERAYTAVAASMTGANIVYEAAGMYGSLMGACPESLLMGNDVLGVCMRMTKGIKVNEDSLSFNVINEVCMGDKSHYLWLRQNLIRDAN